MDHNLHLLANPSHHRKRNIFNNNNNNDTIDDRLILLLTEKFPDTKITEYYKANISKIENLFIQLHNEQIIKEVIEEIIQYTIINDELLS